MEYTNSQLVDYVKISPNKTPNRGKPIDTITIHCVVGQVTVERLGDIFAATSRKASSNYGVGKDGRIGMYVEEKDRSWCSGGELSNGGRTGKENDYRAVTIEVASDTFHPYAVTDAALQATINLCADICRRNGIKKLVWSTSKDERINHLNGANMTVHRDYAKKSCPGDYLYGKMGYIADEVNKLLGITPVAPQKQETTSLPYLIKVNCDVLNVRKGASTSYPIATQVKRNQVYTIVAEQNGWGKLKSGAGWICLAYTVKK